MRYPVSLVSCFALASAANAQVCPPDVASATAYISTLQVQSQEPYYGLSKVRYLGGSRAFLGARPNAVVAYVKDGQARQIVIELPFAQQNTYMDQFERAYPNVSCLRDQCFIRVWESPQDGLHQASTLRGDQAYFTQPGDTPQLSCSYDR